MKAKSLGLLGAITLLVMIAAVLLSREDDASILENQQAVFPNLMPQINEVTEIAIASNDGRVTVARGESQWVVAEKAGYPAAMDRVRETLIGLAELRILEPKTKTPELYQKLGLQDVETKGSASTLVSLKKANGESVADLILGNQHPAKGNPSLDEIYVRKPTDSQTWLAVGNLSLGKTPVEWLDKQILSIQEQRVHRVRVTHPDGETLIIEKEKPEDTDYTVVGLPIQAKIKSQFTVNNISSSLINLSFDDVSPEDEVSFDDQSVVKAVVETMDGLQATFRLLKKDGKNYVTVSSVFQADLILDAEQVRESGDKEKGLEEERDSKKENDETAESQTPKIKPAQEVNAEVADLNERLKGWVFVIPEFRADNVAKRQTDLLNEAR